MPNLQNRNFSSSPGVYKMKSADNTVLYVGKAKSLNDRLRSYFQKSAVLGARTQKMLSHVASVETIVVNSDLEAILLETNLIKELRPKYNVLMKDDKNFVYIRVSVHEDYPRITLVRKVEQDGARYFGPKTAAHKVKDMLKTVRKILLFRHCGLDIKFVKEGDKGNHEVEVTHKVIKYPCLYYYIRRCAAPCIGRITPQAYRAVIDNVIQVLEGRPDAFIAHMKEEMMQAANQQKFEKAGRIRDRMSALEEIMERQRISDPERIDTDIIGHAIEGDKAFVALFQVRGGRMIGNENFVLHAEDQPDDTEIIEAFLAQYYSQATDIPKEVLVSTEFDNQKLLAEWLSGKRNSRVHIIAPKKGEKNSLIELAQKNAEHFAAQKRIAWMAEEQKGHAIEELAEILKVKPPKRIECYDISHLGGTLTVGSMVVFENGIPKKDDYRHFKIRSLKEQKPNDTQCIKEVLLRRLKYFQKLPFNVKTEKKIYIVVSRAMCEHYEILGFQAVHEITAQIKKFLKKKKLSLNRFCVMVIEKAKLKKDRSFSAKPHLIVVDGGKPQLSAALEALKTARVKIPVIALAKQEEEIFALEKAESIKLDRSSEALKLVQRLRDEAHRFAIEFQRKLRKKALTL